MCTSLFKLCIMLTILLNVLQAQTAKKEEKKDNEPATWKKKHITDYTEADLERLYDQWEDNDDEELEADEQPEWKRPQPKVDFSKIDRSDPEGMLKMTKQGKTLMMFATVSGNPSEKETEQVTMLWQSSLFNANYELQRYIVGPNRVLFMIKDGSKAWEIKDFLVKQERCEQVSIENQVYPGKGKAKEPSPTQEDAESLKTNGIKKNKKKKEEL